MDDLGIFFIINKISECFQSDFSCLIITYRGSYECAYLYAYILECAYTLLQNMPACLATLQSGVILGNNSHL